MKKLIITLLTICMFMSILPTTYYAEGKDQIETEENSSKYETDEYNPADWIDDDLFHDSGNDMRIASSSLNMRYSVLVLDVSGSMAGTPIAELKKASIEFCDKMLSSRGNNWVAIVTFASSSAIKCGFSDDISVLTQSINSLSASGGTDTAGGLAKADELYDMLGLSDTSQRNIVLISDGEPNNAQDAYNRAVKIWPTNNVYTLGYNLNSTASSFMDSIQNCGAYNVFNETDMTNSIDQIVNNILSGTVGSAANILSNTTSVSVYGNTKSPSALNNNYVALQGASVTVAGVEYKTDAQGIAKIPTVTSGNITVSKDDYVDRVVTAGYINENKKVYMQKDEGDAPIFNSVTIESTDLLQDDYEIDITEKNAVTIRADVECRNGANLQSLYLVQDSKRADFQNMVLSVVLSEKFDVSENIYIVALDDKGNTTKKVLLFKAGGNVPEALSGFKFNMGGDRSFTLPDSCGFLAGSTVGVGISSAITDLLPVEISTEDNKVYISIGVDLVQYTKSDKYATNAKTGNRAHVLNQETKTAWGKIKDIFDSSKEIFDTDDVKKSFTKLDNFKQTYKNAIKYPKGSFGVSADFTILGFVEGYIDSNGKLQMLDGGVILCPSASASWTGAFAIGPVPCYWEAQIAASVNARLNLYTNAAAKKIMPFGDISGSLSASVGAGAGIKKVLSVGGGITGSLNPLYKIYRSDTDYFRLDAKLNGYFKVTLCGFEYKYDTQKLKLEGTWIEYPESKSSKSSSEAVLFDVYVADNYELLPNDYRGLPSEFTANDVDLSIADDSNMDYSKIKTNVYPYPAPQAVCFDDGSSLIVWLDDCPDRSDINRTALYYSYCSGGVYSEPQMVYDDGTADFYPSIKTIGNNVYIAWSSSSKSLDDTDNVDAMLNSLDTSIAVFDKDAEEIKLLSVIDGKKGADVMPVVFGNDASVYCAWISNSESVLTASEGYSVMLSEKVDDVFAEATEYASNIGSIDSLSGTVYGDNMFIAYCADTDKDIDTSNDIELFINNENISNNDSVDSNVICDDYCAYWYSDGTVYCRDLTTNDVTAVTSGYESTDAFKLLSNSAGYKCIVFNKYENVYSELYGSFYDPAADKWTGTVSLTDFGEAITGFSGFINAEGETNLIAGVTKIVSESEDGAYGQTDLFVTIPKQKAEPVITNVAYNNEYLVEGNDFEIAVTVKNRGSIAAEGCTLVFKNEDGSVIEEKDIDNIDSGEEKEVSFIFTVGSDFSQMNTKISLEYEGKTTDTTDVQLKYEDLSVENMRSSLLSDGSCVVSADIVNRGHKSGANVTASLRKSSAGSEAVEEKNLTLNDMFESQNISFNVENESNTVYYITIDSEDDNSGNDSSFVILSNNNYVVADGGVTILNSDNYTDKQIVIPSQIEGYPVTGIGESAYDGCADAESIVIPDTVVSIADGAFANCSSLKSITIPKSVTYIGNDVFNGCLALGEIKVESGNSKFYDNDGVLFERREDGTSELIRYPLAKSGEIETDSNVVYVRSDAFKDCAGLTSVRIANGGNFVSDYAFSGCVSLTNVEIASGINAVGDYMFRGCTSLENVKLPDTVESVGINAFADCTGISELEISSNAKSIAKGALAGCTGLTTLSIPFAGGTADSNTFLGYIFGASSYNENSAYVPSGLTTLKLTSPDAALNSNALYYCIKLKNVIVSNNRINSNAFNYCSGLSTVTFDHKVLTIQSPFANCSSGIKISGYNDTAAQSFALQNQYTFIPLGDTIPHEVYVSGSCGYDHEWTLYYDHELEVSGLGAIPSYSSGSAYGWYAYRSYVRHLKVNEGITGIGSNAFRDITSLNAISLPSTLNMIGANAFLGDTSLMEAVIPDQVTGIDNSAFSGCTSLDSVTLGENVVVIGENAFNNDTSLKTVSMKDKVTTIGANAFYNCISLDNIRLSEALSSIGNTAFYNCISLESLIVPYTVTSISTSTFNNHLSNFSIVGYKDSYAEDYAISNNIKFVDVEEEIPNTPRVSGNLGNNYTWELSYSGKLSINGSGTMPSYSNTSYYPWYAYRSFIKRVYINGGSSIGSNAFSGYSSIGTIYIAPSVRTINSAAFNGCAKLANVSLSDGLVTISDRVFSDCTSITQINVPESVVTIGENAFYNCNQLETVSLHENLSSIGPRAFNNCTAIKSIEIPYTVISIANNAFYNHIPTMSIVGYAGSYAEDYAKTNAIDFTAVEGSIPDTVRVSGALGEDIQWKLSYGGVLTVYGNGDIPSYSNASSYPWYQYASYIKKVIVADNVTSVGSYAFSGYTNLETAELSDSVKEINTYAFSGDSKLVNIRIPKRLSVLAAYAFNNCSAITGIRIPGSVSVIRAYAFNNCTSLVNVSLSVGITTIENNGFAGCTSLSELFIPYTMISIANNAFSNHQTGFIIKGYPSTYVSRYAEANSIDFTAVSENRPEAVYVSGNIGNDFKWKLTYGGELIIEGVGAMPERSTYDWTGYSSGITKLTVKPGVTSLGSNAVKGCTLLSEINLPESLKVIGGYAFNGCSSLKEAVIPESVIDIGQRAFYGCTALETVYLPQSLKTIGAYAFSNNDLLSSVYYSGTDDQWSKVIIDSNNGSVTSAEIIANSIFERIPVTGLQLTKQTLTMTSGDSEIISCLITPSTATNKSIQWISSDEKVASVECGMIVAKAGGKVIITAKSEDGDYEASCEVTVEKGENIEEDESAFPYLINDVFLSDKNGDVIAAIPEDGEFLVNVSLSAKENLDTKKSLIAAVYSPDGRMVSLGLMDFDKDDTFSLAFNTSGEQVDTVKVCVLDDLTSQKPLAESKKIRCIEK